MWEVDRCFDPNMYMDVSEFFIVGKLGLAVG